MRIAGCKTPLCFWENHSINASTLYYQHHILHISHIMATTATNGGPRIPSGTTGELTTNGSAQDELAMCPPASANKGSKIEFHDNFVQIINGKSASTKATHRGINPATLEPMANVPVATQDDLNHAVTAAKTASKVWSRTPYEDRRSAVLAFANAIESLRSEFRDLLISEQGKPVRPRLQYGYDKSMLMC